MIFTFDDVSSTLFPLNFTPLHLKNPIMCTPLKNRAPSLFSQCSVSLKCDYIVSIQLKKILKIYTFSTIYTLLVSNTILERIWCIGRIKRQLRPKRFYLRYKITILSVECFHKVSHFSNLSSEKYKVSNYHRKRGEASSVIGDNTNKFWKDEEIIGKGLETKVTPMDECDVRNSNFEFLTVVTTVRN